MTVVKSKWEKSATPQEIKRVRSLDRQIAKATGRVKTLRAERHTIILRCNVREWRKHQS